MKYSSKATVPMCWNNAKRTDLHQECARVCFVLPKGDYGGPLVCRGASGFVQVGIMSYGSRDGCALPGHPGVYTRVSKYLRFINDYIHHGEEASAEV